MLVSLSLLVYTIIAKVNAGKRCESANMRHNSFKEEPLEKSGGPGYWRRCEDGVVYRGCVRDGIRYNVDTKFKYGSTASGYYIYECIHINQGNQDSISMKPLGCILDPDIAPNNPDGTPKTYDTFIPANGVWTHGPDINKIVMHCNVTVKGKDTRSQSTTISFGPIHCVLEENDKQTIVEPGCTIASTTKIDTKGNAAIYHCAKVGNSGLQFNPGNKSTTCHI